jgi:hypothetical protein
MRSTMRYLAPSHAKDSRRFIARHLTLWLVLLISGVVVLSSVLAGARAESRKSAPVTGQTRATKSVGLLKAQSPLKLFRPRRVEPSAPSDLLTRAV